MTKLKIGVATIAKVHNFGAELQAYALTKYLNDLGHKAEDIRFKSSEQNRSSKVCYTWKFRILRILVKCVELFRRQRIKKVQQLFETFWSGHMCFSEKEFSSLEALSAEVESYDILFAGSDQIWNPNKGHCLDFFFLHFGGPSLKRVAYAASYGVSVLPDALKAQYQTWLSCFDYISVREEDAVSMTAELVDIDVSHVLDPTLLLDSNAWSVVGQSSSLRLPDERYLLLYVLKRSQYSIDLADYIAKLMGLKVYQINNTLYNRSSNATIFDCVGPAEFIKMFMNASFVVTNSFHGLAFSINFGKPFYSVVKADDPNKCRMESLAAILMVQDRVLCESARMIDPNVADIYTEDASLALASARTESQRFIQCALDSCNTFSS